ncbi:unnamed protein product [Closterium sp. NIES-54]
MIHAAAPHFLWPSAVQYAAHQINLQPRVSLPETTPTLRWTGKRTSCPPVPFPASSLASPLTHPGGSSTTPPRVVFCPPKTSRLMSRCLITVSSHTALPLFLAPGVPPVDPLPPQGPAPSGVSQVDPVEIAVDLGAVRGAEPVGAGTGGVGPGVAVSEGAEPVGAESERVEPGGAEPGGAESGSAEPGGAEFAVRQEAVHISVTDGVYDTSAKSISKRQQNIRAFKRYKLLKLAMGEEKMPEEGDAHDRWIEKSAVLYDLILQSVNNDMFQHIKDLVELDDSGPKVWKLLRDVIQPNTLPMVIVLEKELAALSMRPGDDVKPVLDKIKDTYARMAAAGSNVSQMQQCTKIISVLDNSWDNLIPTLNIQQDQWTPEWLRQQILQEDFRRRHTGGCAANKTAEGYGAAGGILCLVVQEVTEFQDNPASEQHVTAVERTGNETRSTGGQVGLYHPSFEKCGLPGSSLQEGASGKTS